MMKAEPGREKRGTRRIGTVALALALLSFLAGCVVYVPYSAPPPQYRYWR
jgi:hypothetical protein